MNKYLDINVYVFSLFVANLSFYFILNLNGEKMVYHHAGVLITFRKFPHMLHVKKAIHVWDCGMALSLHLYPATPLWSLPQVRNFKTIQLSVSCVPAPGPRSSAQVKASQDWAVWPSGSQP